MPPKTRGSRRRRGAELARNVVDAENISPEEALSQAQTSAEALNPEQLQIILSALDDEVERRCKRLKTEANELALAIRSAVNVEIMKLPKCVRGLSVAQFKETYGKVGHERSMWRKKPDHARTHRSQQPLLTSHAHGLRPPSAGCICGGAEQRQRRDWRCAQEVLQLELLL
mmetsp:Transcript_117/g.409  ORF Transcript_117/g.409 Transcript_117/m.409 type:complete len:171 (+) Transcript_117:179-691(+)